MAENPKPLKHYPVLILMPLKRILLPLLNYACFLMTPNFYSLAALLICYHQRIFRSQLSQIVKILSSQAIEASSMDLEATYIPFLALLARLSITLRDMPISPLFQYLYRNIISSYVSKVPPKPTPPQNWTRAPHGYGCNVYKILYHFLRSPSTQTMQFHRSLDERVHLEYRIHWETLDRSIEALTIRPGSPHTL